MLDIHKTRTWAEVSLSAIEHNCREFFRVLPEGCRLLGVVKADGYGHGAVETAAAVRRAGGSYLAVACPSEALELREAGETLPILILGASGPAFAAHLAEQNITLTVESREKGEALSRSLRPGQRLRVHIKLDTGMGRLGFPAGDREALSGALSVMALPNLEPEGVFTHFAASDEPGSGEDFTREQFRLFRQAVEFLEQGSGKRFALRHCGNSGAVLYYREEGFALDMVRPGLLTYGIYPGTDRCGLELRPAMSLRTRVSALTHHKKGDTVSYGRTWTAERDCTLAVLPIGYADGLHRSLSGKLEVLLHGRRVPQVGRICMDMCMADVTDCPEVRPGDIATVFGSDGGSTILPNELSDKAGTIPYEILCAVSPRVPRIYTD